MRQPQLPFVYLSGPMTGLPEQGALSWRQVVREELAGVADVIDPARDEIDLRRRHPTPVSDVRLAHGKRVVRRNRFDVARADVLLACFLNSTEISIGSVGEIFWADAMNKPVIVVRAPDNVHNHDMLNEIAGWVFFDVESAIVQLRLLLDPSVGREQFRATT